MYVYYKSMIVTSLETIFLRKIHQIKQIFNIFLIEFWTL